MKRFCCDDLEVALAVHLNDDSNWQLANRQTDGLASF